MINTGDERVDLSFAQEGWVARVKLAVIWLCVAAPLVWGIAKTWQEASRLFD